MYDDLRAVELKCYIRQLPQTIKAMIVPFDEEVYISVLASLLQPKNKIVVYNSDKKQQIQLYTNYIKNDIRYQIASVFHD